MTTTPAETTTKANGGGLFTTDESGTDVDRIKDEDDVANTTGFPEDAKNKDKQSPGNGIDIFDTVTG